AKPLSRDGPVSRSALARYSRWSRHLRARCASGGTPGSLRARVEESVLLETPEGVGDHPLFPDVRVVEYTSKREMQARPEQSIAVSEPLLVEAEIEPVTARYLEIIARESGTRVVTVIEFLSPRNKSPGLNHEQYLRKQREICSS